MNRQQFLAELNQYLAFFSPEERAKILADYTGKFEAAGEASEAALLLEFGTPMIVAIELKRRKESGEKFADMSEESYSVSAPKDNDLLATYSVETETYESITAEESEDETKPEMPLKVEIAEDTSAKRTSGTKFALAIVGATLVSLPIALIFIALAAVGVMLVVAMGYLLLTGLKSLYYVTDALFLFAGGLVCGGFGLLIIWFAVWSAISIISKLFRNAISLKPYSDGKERDA